MKYHVTLPDGTREVEVDGERVVVDGVARTARLEDVPGTPLRRLVLDGRSILLGVTPGEAGRWTVTCRGESVEVEAIDERTRHIRAMAGAERAAGGPAQVRAPMPGLVVRVLVEPGARVAAGEGLVVLEAMKMENELRAVGPGVVRAVHAAPGEAVDKGQVLVELAPPGEPE